MGIIINSMNSASFKASLSQFAKLDQEQKRKEFARLCLQLYTACNKTQNLDLLSLISTLRAANPDKQDTLLQQLNDCLEDLAMEPEYFASSNLEYVRELCRQINMSVRYAQAPAILCHYIESKGTKVVKSLAITIYSDGKKLHVRDAKNPVSSSLAKLFNKKEITLAEASKLLPNKIKKFVLSDYKKMVVFWSIDEIE